MGEFRLCEEPQRCRRRAPGLEEGSVGLSEKVNDAGIGRMEGAELGV